MRTIKRVIVIGNGFAGAENQCIGLVRALGLSDKYSLYRITRPRGGVNERLHWLPVSVHKRVEQVVKWIGRFSELQRKKLVPLQDGLRDVLGADARIIAKLARETFERDGPTLIVASGRDTIPVSSSIKQLAPGNVFVIQVQHPRLRLHRFDLVITPRHDYYPLTPEAQRQVPWLFRRWVTPCKPPDKHVVLTLGAIHQADSASLRSAASTWHDELAPLPKPLLVVSVGGPTSRCRYGVDLVKQLAASLQNVLPTCGSLRISFSRRTPKIVVTFFCSLHMVIYIWVNAHFHCIKQVSDILVQELANNPKVYIWNGEDPNPHMGHLAWADAFVVTADSISMLSEACSTGKPVYVFGAELCTWKFEDFLKSLQRRGAIRPFTGRENISERWHYSPLNDAKEAADEVIKALATRGWRLQ